jgi:hypothetical protein
MPYAPGVTYEGGQLIGQGIQSFGQSLGNGMQAGEMLAERLREHNQQQKQYDDQLAERTDKARTFATDFLGLPKGQTAAMSLGDLEGLHDAYVMKAADKIQQQQAAESQANLSLLQQRFNSNQREQGAVDTASQFLQATNALPASFLTMPVRAMARGGAQDAYLAAGGSNPDYSNLLEQRFGQTKQPTRIVDPASGQIHLVVGNQIVPAGTDPKVAKAAPLPEIGHTVQGGDNTTLVFAGRTDDKTGKPIYETVKENAKALDPMAATMIGGQYQEALKSVQELQKSGPESAWTDAGREEAKANYEQQLRAAKFKANQLANSLQFQAPFPDAQPAPAKGKTGTAPAPAAAGSPANNAAKLYKVAPGGAVQFAPGAPPLDALQQMVDDGVISQAAAIEQLKQMGYKPKK